MILLTACPGVVRVGGWPCAKQVLSVVASYGLSRHRPCTNERVAHHSLISSLLQHQSLESSPTYIKYVHNLLSETANKMYVRIHMYNCTYMSLLKYLVIDCKLGNFCV